MTAPTPRSVAPPPERFNFAAHLIERNATRAEKLAYIDDQGSLTYGELADKVRRFAAALGQLGVRREERVLLLMHDCNDWPVAFLGALYAGVVPVAVNTLLTADDYAYMLAIVGRELRLFRPRCCPCCRRRWIKAGMKYTPWSYLALPSPPPAGAARRSPPPAGEG